MHTLSGFDDVDIEILRDLGDLEDLKVKIGSVVRCILEVKL